MGHLEKLTESLRKVKTGYGHFKISISYNMETISTTTNNSSGIDAGFDDCYDDKDNSESYYTSQQEARESLVSEILRANDLEIEEEKKEEIDSINKAKEFVKANNLIQFKNHYKGAITYLIAIKNGEIIASAEYGYTGYIDQQLYKELFIYGDVYEVDGSGGKFYFKEEPEPYQECKIYDVPTADGGYHTNYELEVI